MRVDFIDEISKTFGIKRKDLIEKDLILHQLLLKLSKDDFFSENFVFKGGTCLIKHHLGYFRFSEDIDFTWKDQSVFEGLSQKRIRTKLSKIVDKLGSIIRRITRDMDIEFKCEKSNKRFVELGGGNKFLTFKLWYDSVILKSKSFVKIQINFVEKMLFSLHKARLESLLSQKRVKELEFLFPNLYKDYSGKIVFYVYDVKEILCEKVRTVLTRRGFKARDFVDIYLICKKFRIKPNKLKPLIIKKTAFMLDSYEKYRRNFNAKKGLLETRGIFTWGREKELLLIEIDEKGFYKFLNEFVRLLKDVTKTMVGKTKYENVR